MGSRAPYWMYKRRHKTAKQAYDERRERRRGQMEHGLWPITVDSIVDSENLFAVFKECSQRGQAPGIDHITYTELSNSEVGEICRAYSAALQAETYKAHPTRLVLI